MIQGVLTPSDVLDGIARELAARVKAFEAAKDSRCVFAFCYYLLTRQLRRQLPASPVGDQIWIARLARAFADRYFAALDGGGGHPVPAGWQAVFATAHDRYTSVIEDVLFGMAAHIIGDLPHVLVEVGLEDEGGRSRVSDYHAMNDILGGAIEEIQDAVGLRYAPYIRWLDLTTKTQDEILTNYGIRLARAAAWYNAARLLDPASRGAAAEAVQKSVIVVVTELTRPPWWSARILLRALRVIVAWFRRWPTEPLPPAD